MTIKTMKKKAAPKKKVVKKAAAEVEFESRAAFARRVGKSKQYIYSLVKKGALTLKNNKLNIQQSLKDLEGYIAKGYKDNGHENSDTFAKSRAKNEHYKSLTSELEFKQRSGELIERSIVEGQQFQVARACREAFQSIAGRLAAQVAGIESAKEIEKLIDAEINSALLKLTE